MSRRSVIRLLSSGRRQLRALLIFCAAALFGSVIACGDALPTAPPAIAVPSSGAALSQSQTASASGRVATGGPYNLRSGPGTNYSIVGTIASGTTVTITCTARGTTVTGVYGTTNLWDKLSTGTWISDALVYTGTSNPVAGDCSTSSGPVAPLPVVGAPVFSPQPTNPPSSVLPIVAMKTTTANATIRYTTDGTEPGTTSKLYSTPITLIQTTTLRARAFEDGMTASAVTTATYTIVPTVLRAPTKDEALAQLRLWLTVQWCRSTEAFGLHEMRNADSAPELPVVINLVKLTADVLQTVLPNLIPLSGKNQVDREMSLYATKSITEINARIRELQQKLGTDDVLKAYYNSWCA